MLKKGNPGKYLNSRETTPERDKRLANEKAKADAKKRRENEKRATVRAKEYGGSDSTQVRPTYSEMLKRDYERAEKAKKAKKNPAPKKAVKKVTKKKK